VDFGEFEEFEEFWWMLVDVGGFWWILVDLGGFLKDLGGF